MEKRQWLIDLRKSKNLLQREIAAECGIDQTFYGKIELGIKTPSVPVAKKIGATLNVPFTRFYEEE